MKLSDVLPVLLQHLGTVVEAHYSEIGITVGVGIARPDQRIGEGTSSYLMSRTAAERSIPSSVSSGLRLISTGNSLPSFRSP